MASLDPTERAKIQLAAGDQVRISTTGQCTVQGLSGAPATTTTLTAASQDFGPYGVSAVLLVTGVSGRSDYSLNNATYELTAVEKRNFDALVSEAGTVDAYSTDVWQEITATGLAIPLPVTVKAIKLIGGTTPTLALRDALVDAYTAASASTDLAFDSSVTPIPLGYEFPLNRLFRLGVHATVGGTGSPKWAIKI